MRHLLLALALLLPAALPAQNVAPPRVRLPATQLILGLAPGWDSNQGQIRLFTRPAPGAPWVPASPPIPALFGKNGLAWGLGVAGQGMPGRQKNERDARTPAGIFRIGLIYTEDPALPPGADYPFHRVTNRDAWVDDPASPYYNRHLEMDPATAPPWFAKQRMRLGDPAYRWRIEIRHNSDPPIPGHGSVILFHIRRGPTRPSTGCTTLAAPDLRNLVTWLRAPANPHYAILPRPEYLRLQALWDLPPGQ